MAGIYFHIPYCTQACHYCDFHFSTNTRQQAEMVEALIQELHLRKDYIGSAPVTSIYFGGGTPSLLSTEQLQRILHCCHALFAVEADAEVTFEANPDDMQAERLIEWRQAGVNRLSVGV